MLENKLKCCFLVVNVVFKAFWCRIYWSRFFNYLLHSINIYYISEKYNHGIYGRKTQ